MNEINGYSLFNEVQDAELRNRNRAVVMANIFEDYLDHDKEEPTVKIKGANILLKYFEKVKDADKAEVAKLYQEIMTQERGYKYVG